ncbi:N-6 DNA methylase [Alistipes indistinctus]|uniref:N-6 DNA methylase n=1 Tax=Alistipes indistinctus TaxID=626932 RepID=UPI0036F357E1
MKLTDILKGSEYSLALFSTESIISLEAKITEKPNKKGGVDPYVKCIIRDKEIKLTPEEIVRQLYTQELIERYGYPKERLVFEYPVYFGREAKRADIVIRDKDDFNVAYIIVEVKKPKAKDGREQLKSYTHSTGASMAVWTNGSAITYYQRKNPNYFVDISNIPKVFETLEDILNTPFTMDDLIKSDKLTQTGKSLKDLITEMEDEVLANAGVDVFEEVFKLIFAKLFDEQIGATDPKYNLEFRNSGQSDIQLKAKIEKLFKKACDKWEGVFSDDAKINLTPPHLSICVSSLEGVKLFNSNLDVVDEAFEYLMSKSSKGEKGQYFTPRYVIDMCVKMLNPKADEPIIDTAAGSSGFPVHTIFHVWKNMQLAKNEPVSHLFTAIKKGYEETEYVQNNVFAIDFDEKAVRVARTLNLIAGDGQTNVMHLNTLDYSRWDTVTKGEQWNDTYNNGFKKLKKLSHTKDFSGFDFILLMANPPFAGDIKEGQILSRYELGMKNGKMQKSVGRDILFIERNINFLKPGGRMAIVLPQGRFNNSSDKYIREFIAERCRILAVVGLHGNTFKPHTGTKTSVLFLQKWDDKLCPKVDNYNIFFATQQKEGKNNSGDKLYWKADKSGMTTDPKLALCDKYGHPVIYHDLHATIDYYDRGGVNKNEPEQITPDGIAEAFVEFAKKEQLSFFVDAPLIK